METFQIALPYGLLVFFITSLVAVKVELSRRPSYKEIDTTHQKKELCDEIHRNVNEKLECLPEIKTTLTQVETKIDILLRNNGH